MSYAELHCHSYFSLLDGAESPEALVEQAKALKLDALALTDHDSLAGAMRFQLAAQSNELHTIIGAEISLEDGGHLTLLAEDQRGYANLCRLVTESRTAQLPAESALLNWPGKVAARATWDQVAHYREGLIALSGCRLGPISASILKEDEGGARAALYKLQDIFDSSHLYIELQHHHLPQDDYLVRKLANMAVRHDLPMVATNNVHYIGDVGSRLRDALIATHHNQSLTAARRAGLLPSNSSYFLASYREMARRFREFPRALAASVDIARRCQVSLDFSNRRLPRFPVPDLSSSNAIVESEFAYLYRLCHDNLPRRYPHLTPDVLKQLAHELEIIERAGLAGYFLIVWDIVRYSREIGVRCQGRGSAANSIVAYLLGITSIDPLRHNLLFERFLSSDKFTTPDIDIDFAADRREEVIQYVYRRYGAERTAMVCNVVTYRARSALRDLGKALEFPESVVDRLVKSLDTNSPTTAADQIGAQVPADNGGSGMEAVHPLMLLADLMRHIDGCPRHLAIHSGGMIITGSPLAEIVPLEPATMPGRIVCQWDKDSVEDAGLIKIDLLGLRTLGLITQALDYVEAYAGDRPDLDAAPLDDPAIFQMLQRADTIGTFQVESRAQQQMLPRLKPASFEDMAVEVAIVRPGPIQGGAVHPYLRRRSGLETVAYLHPSLEPVLSETLGVLLFQEQAIRVAVVAAGFTPGEADMLRRAMSRSRSDAAMMAMQTRFLKGAAERGIDPETAAAIFAQLSGFAGYGFCKSHAASFALIAYQTLYLKHYHAPAFYCALLNQQPMGFYSPEVIVGDAKRHEVDLLPPDLNCSDWDYSLEQREEGLTLRAGLRTVAGLGAQGWARVEAIREQQPFSGLDDFCRRVQLDRDVTTNLIRAGACDDWGERRDLLWQLGEIDYRPGEFDLSLATVGADLPALDALERTTWEYELLGLSPAGQVMIHYREILRRAGFLGTWEVKQARPGCKVRVGGMVVVRQRPGTAKGIMFVSLEDESGLLDLVVKPDIYTRFRDVWRGHPLILVEGLVQRSGRATSLLVHQACSL